MADMFKIDVKGIKELQATFKHIDSDFQKMLSQATSAAAAVVTREAKIKCPVDTGTLRRSIREVRKTQSGTRAESDVGTDIEYAPHVEFGTRYQGAQPYLRPALDENEAEIQRAFEEGIKRILGKYK